MRGDAMTVLKGNPVIKGRASGPALVTKMPMNFTASFTKPKNLIPAWRSLVQDSNHDLFNKNIKKTVFIYPATIGSTYTGMVLLELMYRGTAPAAIIVQNADPLLAAGSILADVWFAKGIPIVEYPDEDIFDKIKTGAQVEVNGDTGEITVL
ncbi:MAG: aconitase X swivel domain-containing protein [Desulfomonilia bacterium]